VKTLRILGFALLALWASGAAPAAAKVDVMAANQDLAWIAKTVGGNDVTTDYLAGSNQDPHRIDPRPSQVVKLSRADMIIRIGMDLDLWFDSLIRAANNPKIVSGARGHVDASQGIHVLELPSGKLDPSKGDIHVYGNPHYLFGPSNVPIVARNIRDGLKRVDPAHAAEFDQNYNALVARLNQAIPRWKAKFGSDRGKSLVTYHKSLVYFLNDFGLKELANVEPKPGLEPTPGHVASVAQEMKSAGVKVILVEGWRPRRFTDLLARESGGQVVAVPGGIGAEKGIDDYFSLMDAWVDRVSAAL